MPRSSCLSDLGSAVTGECLHVDAGYHIVGMKAEDAPDIAVVPKPDARLSLPRASRSILHAMARPRPIVEKRFSGQERHAAHRHAAASRRMTIGEILSASLDHAGHRLRCLEPAAARLHHHGDRRAGAGPAAEGYTTDRAHRRKSILGDWDQLTDARRAPSIPPSSTPAQPTNGMCALPGGENYADVAARATATGSRASTADTFAVSHGAFTRILRGLFLGLDCARMSALDEPQGVVFRVRATQVMRLPTREPAVNPEPGHGVNARQGQHHVVQHIRPPVSRHDLRRKPWAGDWLRGRWLPARASR